MAINHSKEPLPEAAIEMRLRQADILPTQQRMQIASVLLAEHCHRSAEQVLKEANARGYQVSKATVYNTLGLFAQKGLVREVIVDPQRVFYDPNMDPHHHFYNVDTGELIDVEQDQVAMPTLPCLPAGTVAEGVDVIIRVRNQ